MYKKRFSVTTVLLLAVTSIVLLGRSVLTQAAPGNPGTPADPILLYREDFENNRATSPTPLTSYTGSSGMTYTANAAWRTNCNGEVLYFGMANSEFANSNCSVGDGTNITTAYDAVRRLAYALGTLNEASDPGANRALTAYTDAGNSYVDPGADLVQFETVGRVSLQNGRRFIVARIDAAAINCTNSGTVQGKYTFYLLDGSAVSKINESPVNACTAAGAITTTPPSLQSNGAIAANDGVIRVGHFLGEGAILSTSGSVGLRMINEEGGGQGNDNAIDNIQFSDASPQLDKAFSPDTVQVGDVSRMTFTVTNTSDLFAKEGWSFSDALPDNLRVADNDEAETDCPNGTIGLSDDRKSVQYQGDLSAGMVSCTLSVNVTSDVAGTYTNGPANLSDIVGLLPPSDAEVTFVPGSPDAGVTNTGSRLYWLLGLPIVGGVGVVMYKKYRV